MEGAAAAADTAAAPDVPSDREKPHTPTPPAEPSSRQPDAQAAKLASGVLEESCVRWALRRREVSCDAVLLDAASRYIAQAVAVPSASWPDSPSTPLYTPVAPGRTGV
eukprot:Rhum_TRINITY_DN13955_c0_g2::Rhum_TRINITY_DN13955_c0_g2_i1::g.66230::m.66230